MAEQVKTDGNCSNHPAMRAVNAAMPFLEAHADDVPLFVERGSVDVGFVGKEVLEEQEYEVYELLDLRVGRSRMVFALPPAAPKEWWDQAGRSRVRVANSRITAWVMATSVW